MSSLADESRQDVYVVVCVQTLRNPEVEDACSTVCLCFCSAVRPLNAAQSVAGTQTQIGSKTALIFFGKN